MLTTKRTNKKLNHKEEKMISLPRAEGKIAPRMEERKTKIRRIIANFTERRKVNPPKNI